MAQRYVSQLRMMSVMSVPPVGLASAGAGIFEAIHVFNLTEGSNFNTLLSNRTTGSLGFGLARETEIVCGVRKADNSFETMSYTFGAKDMGWEKEVSVCSEIDSSCFAVLLFTHKRGVIRCCFFVSRMLPVYVDGCIAVRG